MIHRIWSHFLCYKSKWTSRICCKNQSDTRSCGEPETREQVHTLNTLKLIESCTIHQRFFIFFVIFMFCFFLVTSSPWRLRMSSVQDLPVSRYPSAPSRVRRGAWSPHNVIYYPYSSLVQVPRPNPHSPSWTTKPHWGLWNRYKSFKAKYLIARLIAPDVFLFNMPYSTAIQVQVMCLF